MTSPAPRPAAAIAYVTLVALAATVALVLVSGQRVEDPWIGTFVLATLVAFGSTTPVRIPGVKTSVTVTDPFVFTALAAFGTLPAILVALAGVISAAIGRSSDRRPLKIVFNLANQVLAVACAGELMVLSGVGAGAGAAVAAQIMPLIVATTAYFLMNTVLLAVAIKIATQRPFGQTWKETALWSAVGTFAGLTLAVGLLYALAWVGPSGLALGIPPCWFLATFYRTHQERQQRQEQRIESVEGDNALLEEKVQERTKELRKAFGELENSNERMRDANRQLTAANQAKSEFLANVSHELRTPLNAIIGFSDLMHDPQFGALNTEQTEFLHDIHESGKHLLGLINSILDLSKVEAGKMNVNTQEFDLRQHVRGSVAMLQPQAGQKNLNLVLHCDESLWQARLDPSIFRQIVVNLTSNAVKFTPDGGRVIVELARSGQDDLTLTVTDNGVGIAEDDLTRVFEEFYQVDGSYARSYEGTGLGLALVRRLVDLQQGTIAVRSTVGEGSCFTCRFPGVLSSAARPEEPAPAAPGTPRTKARRPPAGAGPRRVLVVEDNPLNRKLARSLLRNCGYDVIEAVNGIEGVAMARHHLPDLILMDMQMPEMDGIEATRKLRADPRTAELRIVALTAHALQSHEDAARAAGVDGYITKPIKMAEFPEQIRTYLEDELVADRPA